MINDCRYKRVLIKISGEALSGESDTVIHDNDVIARICHDIKTVHSHGHQVSIVIGGGNICRGANMGTLGIERTSGDYMGMLATIINAVALQSRMELLGITTRILSAVPAPTVAEPYIRRKAIGHMEKGRIVIFAGGTGNPFFTTDSAASLRAAETSCNVILKATQVDGVYSADPKKNAAAHKYDELSYQTAISERLNVMDTTAIAIARDNKIPIIIFNLAEKDAMHKVLRNQGVYSIIH